MVYSAIWSRRSCAAKEFIDGVHYTCYAIGDEGHPWRLPARLPDAPRPRSLTWIPKRFALLFFCLVALILLRQTLDGDVGDNIPGVADPIEHE